MGFGRDAERDGALVYLDRAERDLAREQRAHTQTRSELTVALETIRLQRARIVALEAQLDQAQRGARP